MGKQVPSQSWLTEETMALETTMWRHRFLSLMVIVSASAAWAIYRVPASAVDRWVVLVFAGYSSLLAGTFFCLCLAVSHLFSSRVRRGLILGSLLGASTNLLIWFRWIVIPKDSILFHILARLTWIPGWPGVLVPRLWGEEMLLHNPHFTKEVSLWQWTLLTVIDVAVWSALGAIIGALFEGSQHRRARRGPVGAQRLQELDVRVLSANVQRVKKSAAAICRSLFRGPLE
jgi:hypothetical protein